MSVQGSTGVLRVCLDDIVFGIIERKGGESKAIET